MKWKRKALLQNLIARLPSRPSYWIYEKVQMRFGAYRHGNNPFGRMDIVAGFVRKLRDLGSPMEGSRVLEIGSGRTLLVPVGCWLAGAEEVLTVDLHPYLSERMFLEDLRKLQVEHKQLDAVFRKSAGVAPVPERLATFIGLDLLGMTAREVLEEMRIEYRAPADAAALNVQDGWADIHLSVAVLEHVPAPILKAIFKEGVRVTRQDGLFVHRWDMSDHFSHSDNSISSVNFLQFSEDEWKRYNDNRYMYVNRLRIDFFEEMFRDAGLEVLVRETSVDPRSLALLKEGLRVSPPFDRKPDQVNATTAATFYARR
jgi:hypothetical protein